MDSAHQVNGHNKTPSERDAQIWAIFPVRGRRSNKLGRTAACLVKRSEPETKEGRERDETVHCIAVAFSDCVRGSNTFFLLFSLFVIPHRRSPLLVQSKLMCHHPSPLSLLFGSGSCFFFLDQRTKLPLPLSKWDGARDTSSIGAAS